MIKPYYQDPAVVIYHGDCREIVPQLWKFNLLLTDPPYGIERFKKGFGSTRFYGHGCEKNGIEWDNKPTMKTLKMCMSVVDRSIIWGMNNLPLPTTEHFLVWDKQQTVDNFADAEIAWTDLQLTKVFHFSIHQHNKKEKVHPTEKPLKLMSWCISLSGDDIKTILDPFAGSGTTGRAAKDLGRKATLIEIEEKYCEIAARRMAQEVLL